MKSMQKAKFNFRTIEVKEVRAAFAKIKTAKSFGIDNIFSYFLKLALPFIENSLAFLFNTSIETSQFPDSWKVARVTKYQIKAVSAKVSRDIGFLKHAKKFLPRVTLENLYTGIVEPHFRYCCSVWGCCGSREINQLQKLQNRAARIVTNSSFDTPKVA